jgi:hypothetical protein
MYIRVIFKTEIAAGVPTYDYANYARKTVTILNDATAGVTWAPHTQVLADIVGTTITLTVPTPGGTAALNFDILSAPTLQRVKSFRIPARYFPPNTDEPSWWAELTLEIPHDMRQIQFWLNYGNSYVVPDTGKQWIGTEWTLPGDITATIVGPTVVVRGEDTKLPVAPSVVGSTTTLTLIDQSAQGQSTFPDGFSQVIHGVLLYDTGAAGLEADTMTAEASSATQAVAMTWSDHGTWGSNRAIMDQPRNTLITNAATAYQKAAEQAEADIVKYANLRQPWFDPVFHMTGPSPGDSGASPDFGVSKGLHIASTGLADLRALQLAAYQMACRFHHFKEWNVEWMTGAGHLGNPGGPARWTDVYVWDSRTFFLPQGGFPAVVAPPYADGLGKEQGPPFFNPRAQPGTGRSGSWRGYDRQHYSHLFYNIYALMSGDRWCIRESENLQEIGKLQLWPTIDNVHGSGRLITQINASRGEGRILQSVCGLYWATGDPDIVANLRQRYDNIIATQWVGRGLSDAFVKVLNFSGHTSLPGLAAWKPWQENIAMIGLMAAYHVTGYLPYRQRARDICHSITQYSFRNNADSNNKWEGADGLLADPYQSLPLWTPIREADKFNASRNWQGSQFAIWGGSQTSDWIIASVIQGYEFAVEEGNTTWAQKCIDIINDVMPLSTMESRKGPFGWGGASPGSDPYTNNLYDWAAIISDAFKSRGTLFADGRATARGSLSISAEGITVFADGTASAAGSLVIGAIGTTGPASGGIIEGGATVNGSLVITATGQVTTEPSGAATILGSLAITATGSVQTPPEEAQLLKLSAILDHVHKFLLQRRSATVTIRDQVFVMWQGNDAILEFTVKDADGNLVDLTNTSEVTWVLRNDVGSSSLVTKTLTGTGVVILDQTQDATKGKLRVSLIPSDTSTLNGNFYHEINIQLGVDHTLAIGQGLIQPAAV